MEAYQLDLRKSF